MADRRRRRSLMEQLDVLLMDHPAKEGGNFVYTDERYLAAWVVLSRLDNDDNDNDDSSEKASLLQTAWTRHGPPLTDWTVHMLQRMEVQQDDTHYSRRHRFDRCLLRLIAQVATQLLLPTRARVSARLVEALLKAWRTASIMATNTATNEKDTDATLKLNVDLGNALLVWLGQDEDEEGQAEISMSRTAVTIVWDIFEASQKEDEPASFSSKQAVVEETQKQEKNDDDFESMISVLESILNNNISKDDEKHYYTDKNWQQIVLTILEVQRNNVSEDLAIRILVWVTRSDGTTGSGGRGATSAAAQTDWHDWIMTHILQQNNISSGSNSGTTRFKSHPTLLLGQTTAMQALQKLLLAYVVSPLIDENNDDDNNKTTMTLRGKAWCTMAVVVETYGWKAVKMDASSSPSSSSSSMSTMTPMVTWTRLAAGEWKIQLEQSLASNSNDKEKYSSSFSETMAKQRYAIMDGCARVLKSVVGFLVGLEERPDQVVALDYKHLGTLQELLESCLWTTSEYVNARVCGDDGKVEVTRIESSVPSLWSCLFAEMDPSTWSGNGPSVMESLKALLTCSATDETGDVDADNSVIASLLPALAQFLMAAEDDASVRTFMPRLQDAVESYLIRVWETLADPKRIVYWWIADDNSDENAVLWACTCTDLLVTTKSLKVKKDFDTLRHCLLQAIGVVMKKYDEEETTLSPPERVVFLGRLRQVAHVCLSVMSTTGTTTSQGGSDKDLTQEESKLLMRVFDIVGEENDEDEGGGMEVEE